MALYIWGVDTAYDSLLIICTCLVILVSKSFMRRLGMQKGVIKVAVEFCAERTEAASGGEGKYVTLNISSPSRQTVVRFGKNLPAASHLGAHCP